jgi:hypothetical protein
MEKLIDYNTILRGNSAEILDRCRGRNEQLDCMHFVADCHPEHDERMGPFHKTYDCVSLDRRIEFLCVVVVDMLQASQNVKLALDEEFFHAFHLMNDHVIDKAHKAAEILSSLSRATSTHSRFFPCHIVRPDRPAAHRLHRLPVQGPQT